MYTIRLYDLHIKTTVTQACEDGKAKRFEMTENFHVTRLS